MTTALFPVAMLIVFVFMGAVFCYEPKPKIDSPLFAGARPYLSRAQQIDRAIAELGLNYLADAHATNRAVLRKLCHHARGIKGGQHGTE